MFRDMERPMMPKPINPTRSERGSMAATSFCTCRFPTHAFVRVQPPTRRKGAGGQAVPRPPSARAVRPAPLDQPLPPYTFCFGEITPSAPKPAAAPSTAQLLLKPAPNTPLHRIPQGTVLQQAPCEGAVHLPLFLLK